MNQSCWLEPGTIGRVGRILDELNAKSLLLVADSNAYEQSGAKQRLSGELAPRHVIRVTGFKPSPNLGDVQRGLETVGDSNFDAVIAIGGGSAIDLAKLVGTLAVQDDPPRPIIEGSVPLRRDGAPLIAIPTTAGTGSEATRGAVVYLDERKHALQHDYLLPEYAVVDPDLTHSMPPGVTAASGLDALAQAIESLWSVRSTESSQRDAMQALQLATSNLEDAVHRPSPEARHAMCRAAHLAGRAINISNTTASHAVSYALTSRYGVPHGCAVALTLGATIVFNSRVTNDDCADPRGVAHVRRIIDDITQTLGCSSAEEAHDRITTLVRSIGCPTQLRQVGAAAQEDVAFLVSRVNTQRLANNPRRLTVESLRLLLDPLR